MLRMIIQSLFLFMMLASGVTAEEQLSDTTAKNDRVHYQLLPNKPIWTKYSNGLYGYDDLYYIDDSIDIELPYYGTFFMLNGTDITETKQPEIGTYGGNIFVEKYVSSKDELILLRLIDSDGLEFIYEYFFVYQFKNGSFTYLGDISYSAGNEYEYNMMMADKALIPKNAQDYLGTTMLTSDDDFIYLTVTNFLQTNTQHFKISKRYR